MKKWKPKFYIIYPHSMSDNLKWPEKWGNTCRANLPTMLQEVIKTKAIGSEIKLIWNLEHRFVIMKNNNVSSEQIDNYLKAKCCILSFLSERTRNKTAKALTNMGSKGFVFVDNYRDVILYQAHFKNHGEFPSQL